MNAEIDDCYRALRSMVDKLRIELSYNQPNSTTIFYLKRNLEWAKELLKDER